jgi:hypothetical protein
MQFAILLLIAISMMFVVFFNTSLFYWQHVQPDYSKSFEEKGKMEQFGRTGVAAMHAVLIGYELIRKDRRVMSLSFLINRYFPPAKEKFLL